MPDINVDTWSVRGLYLGRDGLDSSQWPKLSCSAANQAELSGSLHIAGTFTATLGPNMVGTENLKAEIVAKLVNHGDNHDHTGGAGAVIKHSSLQLDGGTNPHSTTAADVGALSLTGGTISGNLSVAGSGSFTGNVGIGTTNPTGKLDVQGDIRAGNSDLYFTKTDHNHTGIGNTAGFAAIENSKNYDALMILGRAGTTRGRTVKLWDYLEVMGPLEVQGEIRAGNSDLYFTKTDHNHAGIGNTAGFAAIENSKNYDALMILGRAGTGRGRSVRLWDYLEVNGPLDIRGELSFPKTGGGMASLSNRTFGNEGSFQNNNVKLTMGHQGFFTIPSQPPLTYEFIIGHTSWVSIGAQTTFTKVFSVNKRGDAYFAGGKTGYVVDHFVNRVGDTLEQGDVVVISQSQSTIFSGTDNDIPVLEADLTDKAYSTRVCGIVASVITECDLPYVECPVAAQAVAGQETVSEAEPYVHPLKQFAAPVSEATDRKRVQDQQMGTMVTLDSYAHCKVDADIAPINAGDLLTTSPTRGHAQKVLDPSQAVGAILGKALGSLSSGKGKIAVLVMLP